MRYVCCTINNAEATVNCTIKHWLDYVFYILLVFRLIALRIFRFHSAARIKFRGCNFDLDFNIEITFTRFMN